MSVQQRFRRLLWKRDTTWREVIIIAAALVLAISLIMALR